MRTVNVGDLKTHFSQILKDAENGEKIIIVGGKQSKKWAVIVPFQQYFGQKRKIGLLAKTWESEILKRMGNDRGGINHSVNFASGRPYFSLDIV